MHALLSLYSREKERFRFGRCFEVCVCPTTNTFEQMQLYHSNESEQIRGQRLQLSKIALGIGAMCAMGWVR